MGYLEKILMNGLILRYEEGVDVDLVCLCSTIQAFELATLSWVVVETVG